MNIIGCDEVNFSPSLCGDCVVCCLYNLRDKVDGVKDSKKLTHKQRIELFRELRKSTIYSVSLATPSMIDYVNIYHARNNAIISSAMSLAQTLGQMNKRMDGLEVWIDGKWSEKKMKEFEIITSLRFKGIQNGDDTVYEISAASIVAKVCVDALFRGFMDFYPQQGIGLDHGVLTKVHKEELREKGLSPYHRGGVYAKNWWNKILGDNSGRY